MKSSVFLVVSAESFNIILLTNIINRASVLAVSSVEWSQEHTAPHSSANPKRAGITPCTRRLGGIAPSARRSPQCHRCYWLYRCSGILDERRILCGQSSRRFDAAGNLRGWHCGLQMWPGINDNERSIYVVNVDDNDATLKCVKITNNGIQLTPINKDYKPMNFTICLPYLNKIPDSLQKKLDTHQERAYPYQSRPSVARLYLASGMVLAI